MSAIETLFTNPNAFEFSSAVQKDFMAACRESFIYHTEHSRFYREFSRRFGVKPEEIQDLDDLARLPWILVTVMKHHVLLSVPESEIQTRFTSSGTGGQCTQILLDVGSRDRQLFCRRSIVQSYGLTSGQPANYLIFSYDSETSGDKGAAHTHRAYAEFAPAAAKYFALHSDGAGGVAFSEDECITVLERYSESSAPLRITGFPVFLWRTLQELERRGKHFKFSPESVVFNGGGWKTAADEEVPKPVYIQKLQEILGIAPGSFRDLFGMVEHGMPYISCEYGSFHVPVYSRVMARDPGTLKPLPHGEVGLLNLISPYCRSMPNLSVLSTDWGAVRNDCPCGRGDYLILSGRAGLVKHKGCAITASEISKQG